jgi:hypothetical protein
MCHTKTNNKLRRLLTWVQNFLCFRMAGTKWAVEFEVVHVIQECTTHREEHILQMA